MTPRRAWTGFWALGIIWGSSFLFIRIAVEQLSTLQVVFVRTAIAAVGLHLVRRARHVAMPRGWSGLRDLLILGIVNTTLPFALITWGEQSIDSGMAAVLQATAAPFTLIVAHFTFADERITPRKLAALGIAFVGVAVLGIGGAHGEATPASAMQQVLGQAAVVLASFCYAIGGTYSRRVVQHRLEPIVAAAGAMTVTAVACGAAMVVQALSGGAPLPSIGRLAPRVLGSVVMLGVLNTFAAYLIFYSVIRALGAARTSTVTYIIPVVGLVLGGVVLGEAIDRWLAVGTALILAGLALMSTAPARRPDAEPRSERA